MNWCRIEVVAAALKQCGARTRGFHLAGSVYGIANKRITAQVKPLFPFATSTYPVGVRNKTVAESLTCFGAAVRASATSAARSVSMNFETSFPWAARRAGARVSSVMSFEVLGILVFSEKAPSNRCGAPRRADARSNGRKHSFLYFLQVTLQPVEPLLPELLIPGEVVGRILERLGVDRPRPPLGIHG